MNNLMKAEFFRLRRSGGLLFKLVLVGVFSVLMQFVGSDGLAIDAFTFFTHSSIGFSMSICTAAGFVCETFNSRAAHYEIMKGTQPMLIILNKILVTLIITTVSYFLPTMILLKIFDGRNITLSMMLLMYLCFVKLTVFFVSMCVIFDGGAGTVIALFAFMFESMPLVLLQNIIGINVVPLTSYLTSTQVMLIGQQTVFDMEELSMPLDTSHTEIKVLISFIAVSVIMVYTAYKLLKERRQLSMIVGG